MHTSLQGLQEKKINVLKKGINQPRLIDRRGWTLNLNWSDKKVKTKNFHGCFEIE